jgi:hypothetical protein
MWQVFLEVRDYEDTWYVPQEGEVFATEAEADRRAAELDGSAVWPDCHVVKEVDE